MQKINLGYDNGMVMPFVHWLLGIFMYTAKVEKFQPLPVYEIYIWSDWSLVVNN